MGLATVMITKELMREWLLGNFPSGERESNAPDDLQVVEVRECRYSPRNFKVIVQSHEFSIPQECQEPETFILVFSPKE